MPVSAPRPSARRATSPKRRAALATRTAPAPDSPPAGVRNVVHIIPRARARLDRMERYRTNTKWGDVSASRLIQVMQNAAKGDVAEWADFCEFAIDSDELFLSLYDTRVSRVVQADWIVAPSRFGDRRLSVAARNLCDQLLGRVENVNDMIRWLLHAIAPGFSNIELHWGRDDDNQLNFVTHVEHVHGHRFRYDLNWQPRLYDQGMRHSGDGYGEHLRPNGWVTHVRQVQAGYPGVAGIMRSCAIKWLFRRWAAKWEVANLEVHGRPLVYAEVGPNTPETVRDQILEDLGNLSADHYGIMETGTKLIVDATAAAARNYEAFREFANATKADITTAWMGFSDAIDPGEHGSQSAIEGLASISAYPKMVADGIAVGEVIARQLFRPFLRFNSHKLGVPPHL